MESSRVYEVFFTGKNDPRDGCVVIGEDTKPIFFRFESSAPAHVADHTRTTLFRNAGDVVALIEWSGGYHLGAVSIASRSAPIPISSFVMNGSSPNSRAFYAPDGRQFEWKRCDDDPHSYDLYRCGVNPARIASYRRCNQPTPVGPSYAFMSYVFDDEVLMLEGLVALCINRCVDAPAI